MQYRKFGNTELFVSEVGFGAWAIGGGAMIGTTSIGWGDTDDAVSKRAIHEALDRGINFFDTADIYGLGHSEKIIGETIGNDHRVIIATKVGNVSRNDQFTVDYSKEHIYDACDESLRRLKRERIDYYQLHSARIEHLQKGECIDAMEELQKQGKITYWGLSLNTFDPFPEADHLMLRNLGNGFQLVLNILNQKALPILEQANNKGYSIIARMPLQFGLLTGKFDANSAFPLNDHRRNRLTKQVISNSNEALKPVWELCKKYDVTKTQLALSYVLSYPAVSTIIPGIRTPGHVVKNTTGLTRLDDADLNMIESLGKTDLASVMELIEKQG
ncbi:MAG TPA: aldo/keto reductase [Chitinophagaceae bacterium]|jgi:aryl-alcohol dehydrogenase-like predicted oxidoreductase|nr:aldo/keto reductase [Chitinophagaceae bacterium]